MISCTSNYNNHMRGIKARTVDTIFNIFLYYFIFTSHFFSYFLYSILHFCFSFFILHFTFLHFSSTFHISRLFIALVLFSSITSD